MNKYPDKYESSNQHVADTFRKHVSRQSFIKKDLADTAVCAWRHVTRQQSLIKELMEENRELNQLLMERDARVMDRDDRVIQLQAELLESKGAQLEALTSTVQTVVKDSVEKSWSDVAARVQVPVQNQPIISSADVHRVVQEMSESEERATNLIMFGLTEEGEPEELPATVSEVFESLGEKPPFESAMRLGVKKTDYVRPVLVKFRTTAGANAVLKKCRALRNTDKFRTVFISPDRTKLQRMERRELVDRMKEQASRDSKRRYFIRNGEIESVDRASALSTGDESKEETDSENGSSEEESDESDEGLTIYS